VCHQIGEGAKNFVGPELNGLIGRKNGSVPNYNYSDSDKNSGITWDEATLKKYLVSPKAMIPGTKMIFAGLPKEVDRDNLVAYLAQFDASGKKK
ncbi:MAG: c-type cytochrome, partial [Methylocella sp.]